jgi:hypothetical protein
VSSKLLQKLNPNKAAGPDNIRPKISKELAAEIASILTYIQKITPDMRSSN